MADLDVLGRLAENVGGRQERIELELAMAEKLATRERRDAADGENGMPPIETGPGVLV